MWPERVSNPGPLTYESGALPTIFVSATIIALGVSILRYEITFSLMQTSGILEDKN